jgi:hypothetical protein
MFHFQQVHPTNSREIIDEGTKYLKPSMEV